MNLRKADRDFHGAKGLPGAGLAVMVLFLSACSHYSQLSDAYHAYQPPAMAFSSASTVPEKTEAPRSESDFSRQKEQLAQMARSWEAAVQISGTDHRFYSPDKDRLSQLAPAGRDAAAAARVLGSDFTLESLETLALLRNPGVMSAEKSFQGKLRSYSQVTDLDDILRQYSAFTQSVQTGVGDAGSKESPAMKFPFPGIMALKGQIVDQEVEIARQALETARKKAITDSRRVFWNLTYNRHAREITGATLDLLAQLELSARKRYEVGRESIQNVIRVQIQEAKLREALNTLQQEKNNLQTDMRKIANLVPDARIGMPVIRTPRRDRPDAAGLTNLALAKSQELLTLRAMIAKTERVIELGETEIYPRFTQNLSLFDNNAADEVGSGRTQAPFKDVAGASMGAGLPKDAWFGLGNAYLAETRDNLAALRQQLQDAENRVRFQVREGWYQLDLALREERLYTKKIEELSRLSAELTDMRYETGVAEMRDVIDFYTTWFEARLAGERKISDIGIARAELEEIVGISF